MQKRVIEVCFKQFWSEIVHFTVACLVAKPLNRSEAKGDLVMIQTLLLFKCKLLCYHANWILVSITTRSPSASIQIKGLATKYTTVKWPIVLVILNQTCAQHLFDFEIVHVFSDQIALHSVQLPLLMSQNKKYCK